MSSSVELIRYLAMQQASLQELHSLLKEEQRAITAVDTERMNEINILKETVHQRQRSVMLEGQQVVAALAKKLALPKNVTIGQIIERLDPRQQAELHLLQNGVAELAARVMEVATDNKKMLERFLSTVNESLGFILRVLNSSSIYGSSGSYLQHNRTAAMMVNREA